MRPRPRQPTRTCPGAAGYCGGATPTVSVRLTVWSDGVTQVIETDDPPCTPCRMPVSDEGDETFLPSTLVITSPATMPD